MLTKKDLIRERNEINKKWYQQCLSASRQIDGDRLRDYLEWICDEHDAIEICDDDHIYIQIKPIYENGQSGYNILISALATARDVNVTVEHVIEKTQRWYNGLGRIGTRNHGFVSTI